MAGLGGSSNRLPKSFRDVLQGSSSSSTDQVKYSFGEVKGAPALLISDDDVRKLAKPYALTLIGKFSVSRPSIDVIRKFIHRMKFDGVVCVDQHDKYNVIFRFALDADYNRFFAHRYYTVFGVNMRVVKWSPFMDVAEEMPIVALWVCFPGLRFQFFNKETLMYLGRMFGNPLSVDSATLAACGSVTKGNMTKARVLVEIDISKPFPDRVWIGSVESGAYQKAVVENPPPFCQFCSIVGHSKEFCPVISSDHPSQPSTPRESEGNLPIVVFSGCNPHGGSLGGVAGGGGIDVEEGEIVAPISVGGTPPPSNSRVQPDLPSHEFPKDSDLPPLMLGAVSIPSEAGSVPAGQVGASLVASGDFQSSGQGAFLPPPQAVVPSPVEECLGSGDESGSRYGGEEGDSDCEPQSEVGGEDGSGPVSFENSGGKNLIFSNSLQYGHLNPSPGRITRAKAKQGTEGSVPVSAGGEGGGKGSKNKRRRGRLALGPTGVVLEALVNPSNING